MPRKKEALSPSPLELMLARSLFRADKWDPERDTGKPFEWDELRLGYIRKASRLMRTFEKDGLKLVERAPTAMPQTTVARTQQSGSL